MDNSSVQELSHEIERVFDAVNSDAGFDHLVASHVAPIEDLRPVVNATCRIVARACANSSSKEALKSIRVPWYYRTHQHVDHSQFSLAAANFNLGEDLIPVAMFVYRGLCYAGYANHFRHDKGVPIAYLASPGRLQALQPIISAEALKLLQYPLKEYVDLVSLLDLPKGGYNFSHLGLDASLTSSLALAIANDTPQEALRSVYRVRRTDGAARVRNEWARRVWGAATSCAVGADRSNIISGATIHGNVNMMIHAAAA